MLQGAGFEVVNIGINNPVEKYLARSRSQPDILGMSALLTTTMPYASRRDTCRRKACATSTSCWSAVCPLSESRPGRRRRRYCRDAAMPWKPPGAHRRAARRTE
jgi:hypothetical protein